MLTFGFYRHLGRLLRGSAPAEPAYSVAIGSGDAGWDRTPPLADRTVSALRAELLRTPVPADSIAFLDDDGAPASEPTARVGLGVAFAIAEALGPVRECGLWLDANTGSEGPVLISYFTHARIELEAGSTLRRTFMLDLIPRRAPGLARSEGRYIGNASSRELHDGQALRTLCQVAELRYDNRVPFASIEHATSLGYDFCAYCFAGRSQR